MVSKNTTNCLGASSLLFFLCPIALIIWPIKAFSNASASGNALGVNCRGSYLCPSEFLNPDYVGLMLDIAEGRAECNPGSSFNCGPMNDTDYYKGGAHIICLPQGQSFLGGICAFTQGHPTATKMEVNPAGFGIWGTQLKQKLRQLSLHGCRICGSVPLGKGNDPGEAGILTVNYISGVACKGLCPPTHYYV